MDSHLLALGALGEVPAEEEEERLHLDLEVLQMRCRSASMRWGTAKCGSHLLLYGVGLVVANRLDQVAELIAHRLGRHTRRGRLEVLSS